MPGGGLKVIGEFVMHPRSQKTTAGRSIMSPDTFKTLPDTFKKSKCFYVIKKNTLFSKLQKINFSENIKNAIKNVPPKKTLKNVQCELDQNLISIYAFHHCDILPYLKIELLFPMACLQF